MTDPIEPVFIRAMNLLAEGIDETFNGPKLTGIPRRPKIGFALFVFEFGRLEHGRVNYISNGDRQDMIAAMKEWIARAEGAYVEPPAGLQ